MLHKRGNQVNPDNTSWRRIFRLVFVIFSLYLLGDAFYRWDGFRYYATFSEFLPSVALATILWSIVAALATVLIWLSVMAMEWFCRRLPWAVGREQILFFMSAFFLSAVTALYVKRSIWPYAQTTPLLKAVVLLCVLLTAVFLSWLFRKKSSRWIGILQERVTPLVWLFAIWMTASVFLVSYFTWIKEADNTAVLQKTPRTSVSGNQSPNIILLTFDTLTARDMSLYGYPRQTTPFISEWSKTASVFTRAEAEGNITTPTTASLMTGKRIWTHQTYHVGVSSNKPLKSDVENLPLLLKENGYYTMAFVVNPVASVKTLGIAGSFEIAPLATEFSTPASLFGWRFGIVDVLLYRMFANKIKLYDWILQRDFILDRLLNIISRNITETTAPPSKVYNGFLEALDNNSRTPFFAWLHVFPPHDPYLPPEPYLGMFDSSSRLRSYKTQERERRASFKYSTGKYRRFPQAVQETIDIMRARYDEFIRYSDSQFEDFISELIKRNKLKNTVIILSADHGESFEHAYLGHGQSHLYEQVTHIPLIIKNAGQSRGQVIDDMVEQIDIAPTILDLAGIAVPSWMEGRSLVPLMQGGRLPPRPAFSMVLDRNPSLGHRITKGTIAVWEGDYKLIHYLDENRSLLFNLKKDPAELNNLFDKEPETGRRLLALLKDNLRKANDKIGRMKQ